MFEFFYVTDKLNIFASIFCVCRFVEIICTLICFFFCGDEGTQSNVKHIILGRLTLFFLPCTICGCIRLLQQFFILFISRTVKKLHLLTSLSCRLLKRTSKNLLFVSLHLKVFNRHFVLSTRKKVNGK